MASHTISTAGFEEHLSPDSVSGTRPQIVVIADDLTGACDSASAFLRNGHTARVWLTADTDQGAHETVWVRHTASRDLSPAEAARAVALAAQSLPATPGTLLFKKVDSAARGNIASELFAARVAYKADIILFAPAFPATGRIVLDGVLQITDAAGQNTSITLAELFPVESRQHIVKASTPAQLTQALSSQPEIILCDATTDSDLQAIARTASQSAARILWAGSAGLANALATLHSAQSPASSPANAPHTKNILVCIGTSHNVTQLQVKHLLNTPRTVLLPPNEQQFGSEITGILQITCKESDADDVRHAWQQLSPQALVLTGGDTAAFVLEVLKANAITLKGDVAPGVPWGIVEGGQADQLPIVTKSGGFGDEASLTNAIAFLRGQS
jgi:uncharacterized protein YgbK (DUF1537 family)